MQRHKNQWQLVLKRTSVARKYIIIQAEHLPGVANYLADRESRTCINSSNWQICPNLIKQFLVDRDTDLFAMRLTRQLPLYMSWHPDPHALTADAFTLNWGNFERLRLFPIQHHTANLTQGSTGQSESGSGGPNIAGADLVASSSTTCNKPSSSPAFQEPADPTMVHPMFPCLHLAIWHIFNDHAQQKAFQNRLPNFSQPLLVNRLTKLMTLQGENGVAGVINGKLIQFQQA